MEIENSIGIKQLNCYHGFLELLFGAVDVEERRQTEHKAPPGPRADAVQLPHIPLDAADRYILHLSESTKNKSVNSSGPPTPFRSPFHRNELLSSITFNFDFVHFYYQ